MPAHNTIPHTARRCTATRSHRIGEGERGREWDTVKRGRREKKDWKKERRIAWEHSEGKVDHHAEEGRLEQREARRKWIGSVKDQSPFPPTMPERLKTRERRDNFRWALTEWSVTVKKEERKYGSWWFPRQHCGNSKDDANHLWVTSSIHHPCYSSNIQHRPSSKATHAHIVYKSLRAAFHCGWKLSHFYMWKAENLLPEWDRLSDQAICD